MDPLLDDVSSMHVALRYINIALLCVQESAADRPTMSEVVAMSSNESAALPNPKEPAFLNVRTVVRENPIDSMIEICSANDASVSVVQGRYISNSSCKGYISNLMLMVHTFIQTLYIYIYIYFEKPDVIFFVFYSFQNPPNKVSCALLYNKSSQAEDKKKRNSKRPRPQCKIRKCKTEMQELALREKQLCICLSICYKQLNE